MKKRSGIWTKDIEDRLKAVENTLKRKGQCLACGFDHGIDDSELFGQMGKILVKHLRAKTSPDKPELKCICTHEMDRGRVPRTLSCPKHGDEARENFKEYARWVDSRKPDPDKSEPGHTEKTFLCKCIFKVDPDCKTHGGQNTFMKIPNPALPLHARVHRALGHVINLQREAHEKTSRDIWRDACPFDFCHSKVIPDYRTLEQAHKALEKYCRRNDLMFKIERTSTGQGYIGFGRIMIGDDIADKAREIVMYQLKSDSLPLAICEAIVNDSEGVK